MFFVNNCFAKAKYSLGDTPMDTTGISDIRIHNGVYDAFACSSGEVVDSSKLSEDWGRLYFKCLFNGNLDAGNIDFDVGDIQYLKIKRRRVRDTTWIDLWTILPNQTEYVDYENGLWNYTRMDYTVASNVEYEYGLTAVSGNSEGNSYSNSVLAEFRGLFLVGREGSDDIVNGTDLDVKITTKQNRPTNVVNTLNTRYPFVIHNSQNRYKSGTLSALYLSKGQGEEEFSTENTWARRADIEDFLSDGLPKIIKYEDGRIYLVAVSSSEITETEDGHREKVSVSFDWAEIGDANDGDDLYNAGLLDRV